VTLAGCRVLISVESPHQFFLNTKALSLANDSFLINTLLAFLGRYLFLLDTTFLVGWLLLSLGGSCLLWKDLSLTFG
jgi:hypothetical protein